MHDSHTKDESVGRDVNSGGRRRDLLRAEAVRPLHKVESKLSSGLRMKCDDAVQERLIPGFRQRELTIQLLRAPRDQVLRGLEVEVLAGERTMTLEIGVADAELVASVVERLTADQDQGITRRRPLPRLQPLENP